MAMSLVETQVSWASPGVMSKSITSGSNATSDEININASTIAASISCKADNSTTAAADDQIYFWLLQTSGDPDSNSTDEFDTVKHAIFLGVGDTYAEDPAIFTTSLPLPQKGFKVYAEGATAGTTNSITVSATITEQRV